MPSAVTDTTYDISGSAANDYDQHHNDDDEPRANGETQSLLPFAQRATRRFGVTREELVKLVRAKDDDRASEHLQSLGGVEELCKKLHTSSSEGLRIDHEGGEDGYDVRRRRGSFLQFYRRPSLGKRGGALSEQQQSPEVIDRQRVFGKNPPMVTFWQLLLKTYNDKTLIMLTIAAVISLIINIYDDLWGSKRDDDTKLGWVDGAAILVAVLVVCLTNAINDYNQEKNFRKLNAKKDDRMVRVIRMGRETEIPVADIVVGDILLVECGDVVPVDGIVTSGSRLACDESSLTGESDQVKKGLASEGRDPLIISGSQVTDGGGRMVVIAVGESSSYGRFINMLQSGRGGDDASSDTDDEADAQDSSETPLQRKLDVLVEHITKFGIFSALLMLIVLLVRYLVTYSLNSDSLFPPFDEFIGVMVGIIIQAITIVVIAVPEGLPMAVTIALVYASSRMIKDNNLVRQLAACETMGGVTA
ncbi:plasma membrane calcium, partial [Spiromyces aspiralis]